MRDHLDRLENTSIFIIREAYASCRNLGMLWSVGKDSTTLLHLARKAFFGHVPFPLIHIDTGFKIPEMLEYRDKLTVDWKLNMMYGINEDALKRGDTFPGGKLDHVSCCRALKTDALRNTIQGTGPCYRFNHRRKKYERVKSPEPFTGIMAGIRAGEEGSRSKERYFSSRDRESTWHIGHQPPEFWNLFNTGCPPGEHVRVHPLLDWTELNIWESIQREKIQTVSLYYNNGSSKRYRYLGCHPCTFPIDSEAATVKEIIDELKTGKLKNIAERSGRAQDREDRGGLETLRREGYM